MRMKRSKLWTGDFTRITLATALSVIGGEAINIPIGLLVFDETRSTLLSALVMACGFLPDVLVGVVVAPVIDRGRKKRWIVAMDAALLAVYLLMAAATRNGSFRYGLYVAFSLITATVSVLSRLAYDAWYPDLIPEGCEQKGYAVSAMLYPAITIAMSPLAAWLYTLLPMHGIFLGVAGLLALSIAIESGISKDRRPVGAGGYSLAQWREDCAEGFRFIRREKGIRNIYAYMGFAQGAGEGMAILTRAFFQTSPILTVTMLGFMQSAEMVGRVLGGLLQYRVEVSPRRRYGVTRFVYVFYQLMDMALLFMPYGAMLVNRMICGGLGTVSATLRSTAVQSYLPGEMRARVNAVFDTVFALGSILFQLLAGALGQAVSHRGGAVILSAVVLLAAVAFIIVPAKQNRPVYEAVRTSDEG